MLVLATDKNNDKLNWLQISFHLSRHILNQILVSWKSRFVNFAALMN